MDQLLVALDVDSGRRALELADSLKDIAGGFKIGSRLFTAEGPGVVRALADRGIRIFLDLKFHDIPNTVADAVTEAARLGVWMLNVHASGGRAMMEAAHHAAFEAAASQGLTPPLVIAVTALTSLDEQTLQQAGVSRPLLDHVLALATAACESGLAGVVASPQELRALRARFGDGFLLVTPGIRHGTTEIPGSDDQRRTMTAADALRAGASYIVVGRPIITAHDPRAVAERIAQEARP